MSKAEKTREFIIEKTATIFNKKGYAGTSLSDLTDATGLTKGSLYGNFKNKDEIALAVFDYNTRLLRAVTANTEKDKSAIEWLLGIPQFYTQHFTAVAERGGCPILNTAVEADDNMPMLKKKVNQAINSWKKAIERTIETGIENGEIKTGVNAGKYAAIILSLVEGGILLSKSTGDLSFIYESLDRIRQVILNEVKK